MFLLPSKKSWRNEKERKMGINKELLEILACPKCKGEIRLTPAEDGLICDRCRLLYEIREDIPIMLIDEAKPLER
jgi:uncharacterized protein YbaR (Trm112 family)